MKAQILKIAGVKSEKEFYKKYPSEEAFMKQHGKAFKKAQMGTMISGGVGQTSNPKMINLQNMYDEADMDVTGMTDEMRQKQYAALQAAQAAKAPASGGGGDMLGSIMGMLGKAGGAGGSGGGDMSGIASALARYGADIPRAQVGANMPSWYQDNPAAMQTNYQQVQPTQIGPNQKFPKPAPNTDFETPSVNGYPRQGFTDQELVNQGAQITGDTTNVAKGGGGKGIMDTIAEKAGPVGQLYGSYQALRGERRARKAAEQQKAVSDITLKASQTRPEQIQRKYVRPEDIQNTGEEFFPIYGVGTNPLARNGAMLQGGGRVGGNPTEIQNTYGNGNSLFDDLGYEPLTNPNQVKSFYHGGRLHSMQDGGNFDWAAAGNLGTNVADQATGNNAGGDIGGQLGGTAGEAIGNAILPGIGGKIGKEIGQVGGTLAGGFLDTNPKAIKRNQAATKRNIQTMALNSGFQGIQGQNVSYMEDGGYVSHDWQPQVIATFGEHKISDLLRPPHDADMLRAGGHLRSYTPPSERAMQTYDDGGEIQSYGLGGELQTHWGGGFENLSYNPYLPGTGITGIFRGKSHEERSPNGETGIGVTYGGNPVEVERGEPMVELEEGGTIDPETGEVQKSGVVFGNLKIPNQYIDMLGDKSAKGKKFKNYVNDLSKGEERQNKIIEKSTNELNDFTPITPFDKLKMTSLQANLQGANMKLKEYADKKINAAALQNAINDTAEEHGIVADDLARGKVKIDKEAMKSREARWGDAIEKAADGKTVSIETTKPPKMTTEEAIKQGYKKDSKGIWKRKGKSTSATTAQSNSATAMDKIPFQNVDKETGISKKITPQQLQEYKKKNSWYPNWDTFDPKKPEEVDKYAKAFNARAKEMGSNAQILSDKNTPGKTSIVGEQFISANFDDSAKTTPPSSEEEYVQVEDPEAVPEKNKANWMNILNAAIPYLRPSDQEALDMEQLYPEMYAMSSNQLEPVPAQGYQPDLGVPYDVSFQDQLNANQSDYRAMQRMVGYNPAAQANLNAQKYQANQGVLGEQFRANQAMKDKVYGENRNILNDAKLKNLAIYDQQYGRQAQALSNTKATTLAALSSISDKYAKNKLENKTLGVMENMYNYRFDEDGRAINMNPLAQLNWQGRPTTGKSSGKGLAEGKGFSYDENGNIIGVRSIGKEEKEKNGKSIKAKNGSIVRSYKNI